MSENSILTLHSSDLFPLVEELLKNGTGARLTVSGNSMWPLIRSDRDSVLLVSPRLPPHVGDIVVSRVFPEGGYLLHRVHRAQQNSLVTLGDGCLSPDSPVSPTCVIARAETVYRGKRAIRLDAFPARLYARLWRFLLPVRAPLLRALRAMARGRARLRKMIKKMHDGQN